jgi:hypothetical protein
MAAYGPQSLSLDFLARELAFDDAEECRAFAVGRLGCVPLAADAACLDTRASRRVLLGVGDGGGTAAQAQAATGTVGAGGRKKKDEKKKDRRKEEKKSKKKKAKDKR